MNNNSSILGLFIGIILWASNSYSQIDYKNQGLVSISFGYGFYSPGEKVLAAYKEALTTDEAHYGGIYADFKYLHRTDLIYSRIKLGGEIFIQQYRSDRGYNTVSGSTIYVYGRGAMYLNGNHFTFLTDFLLFQIKNIPVHIENGFGVLLFSSNIYDVPFEPITEIIFTSKAVVAIPISKFFTIDPQIGILKGFSNNDIFSISTGVGISVYGRLKKKKLPSSE